MSKRRVKASVIALLTLSSTVLLLNGCSSDGQSKLSDMMDNIKLKLSSPEVAEDAVNVEEFGVVSNADYYNSQDGNYYSDGAFENRAADDTESINRAISYASRNGISTVYIPKGNYLIDAKGERTAFDYEYATRGGIQLESGITLLLDDEAVLMTDTVDANGYSIVTIDGKENVAVRGGKIIGDSDTHPPDAHNYCYGITIANGSKNIVIEDIEIMKNENDGIMIADYKEKLSGGKRTSNVEIRKVKSHQNGRQGLTISTGKNIKVLDSEFSNQTKHSPKSGIDIELESYDHIGVENVEIFGNSFYGNEFSGIVFSDMFNEYPGSMSKDIVIKYNTVLDSRFGIIAPGKAEGIEIVGNDISLSHLIDEFSAGIGSTSVDSKEVLIADNKIKSDPDIDHFSSGIVVSTPDAEVVGNEIVGARDGIVLYGSNTSVSENSISDVIDEKLKVVGDAQDIWNNQLINGY